MELTEQARIDGVWQRVRGSLPLSFCHMAQREERIAALSRGLYRMGADRKVTGSLYRQAVARKENLLAMSRLAGEPDCRWGKGPEKADLGELVRQLGLAAAEYDPEHPVYGTVFAQFRKECTDGQRALLRVK